jgi:hypothetical protein
LIAACCIVNTEDSMRKSIISTVALALCIPVSACITDMYMRIDRLFEYVILIPVKERRLWQTKI